MTLSLRSLAALSLGAVIVSTAAGCSQPGGPQGASPAPSIIEALGVVSVASAATPPPGAQNPVCEVEIAGHVNVPQKWQSLPSPLTFVALGDCLAPDPKVVGFGGSTRGRFFVEVFVPWGSDLTLCAAIEPQPGAAATIYGKAKARMHAAARGEVEFKKLVVELAEGPPRTFPHTAGPR